MRSVLGETVRQWAAENFQDDPEVAELAASIAELAYGKGASVAEACMEARSFLGSWMRHPSHWGFDQVLLVGLAS